MEPAAEGEGFPKRARLTKRSEFLTLSREGKRVHTSHFIILSKVNDAGLSRLGITVTTRIGNAVIRNRVKRLVREYFRRHKKMLPSNDIVVIAKQGADRLSLLDVESELSRVLSVEKFRQR
jgi:ribonuclease P protein component